MARLYYLDRRDVEHIVHRVAARLFADYSDPLPAVQVFGGMRDGGALLESALALPRQPYYRRLHDKGGALLRSLIKNHPLVDGNKRIGVAATFVFLLLNGWLLVASNGEMVRFALEVAASESDMSWQDVASWLRQNTVDIAQGQQEAIRMLRERGDDADEAVERLLEVWAEIMDL
ncbi:MAG: type II toxin-antitoxin system death-on-curing family toxin [Dehalococcoidia bacterium]